MLVYINLHWNELSIFYLVTGKPKVLSILYSIQLVADNTWMR